MMESHSWHAEADTEDGDAKFRASDADDTAESRTARARDLQTDPTNEQYLVPGLESALLHGGDMFVGLGNFDFFTPGAAGSR
ncbi:MAG: hypothetical protein VKO64_08325 [Candidatus Sericytochromatia bacterium]|nr:hypothetical protein [Candidatus Sericytochromatia bacterium]